MSLILKLRTPLQTTLWLPHGPQTLAGLTAKEIAQSPLQYGNQAAPLGDLFTVDGSAADGRLEIAGDLTLACGLATGMTAGEVVVRGSVGHHVGEQIRGGYVRIEGDAGDWLGAEMRGGVIDVQGSAGRSVGAALPGSGRGMTGGEILVRGSVGHDLGWRMRRGLIAVAGDVGEFAGQEMLAGTILALGKIGAHPGAGMRRGTLLLPQVAEAELLPTFTRGALELPTFVRLIVNHLRREREFDAATLLSGALQAYHGDMLALGRGEIFVAA
jgi:formylmethanofuran dehydrogenase subunit C